MFHSDSYSERRARLDRYLQDLNVTLDSFGVRERVFLFMLFEMREALQRMELRGREAL